MSKSEGHGTEPARFYFDISEGLLLVGQEAAALAIESGVNPEDVLPLENILLDQNIHISTDTYTRLNTDNWEREDYQAYGRWLLDFAREHKPDQRLDRTLLQRTSYLGIGPVYKRVARNNFGTLANFSRAIGEKPHYTRGEHSKKPVGYFEDYVEETFLAKPTSKNLEDALWERSNADEGPSPDIIRRHGGKIRNLLERRGYVDVPSWVEDDYILWGVRFMVANDGLVIKTPYLQSLSAQRRGPSTFAIETYFGGVLGYSWRVELAYKERLDQEKADEEAKLAWITENWGTADHEIYNGLFRQAAQYRVSERLLPRLQANGLMAIAKLKNPEKFVERIRRTDNSITAADIEGVAVAFGVYDDIWPVDSYKQYLRVV